MKMLMFLTALAAALMLTALPGLAQDQAAKPDQETAKLPSEAEPRAEPSASPATGGDTRPSAVDPAEATRTGANTGEGASYNRSNEKGDSVLPKDGDEKK
jgi:hypothetical protein